jgi:hypothetical protein
LLETHIMMILLIFCLVLLLVLHLISFIDPTIAHMVLVHERIAVCLDALVTVHVLIMVIIPRVGTVFLLEGLTLIFSLRHLDGPCIPPSWFMSHSFKW